MWILDLITSWWHWVFVDLMGHSVVLMFLFGWEIFLAPFAILIGLVGMVFTLVVTFVEDLMAKREK